MTPEPLNDHEHQVAVALSAAHATATAIAPVRESLGTDLDSAYRVQTELIGNLRDTYGYRTGRKVGLTSPAVQEQLGVDQPDFGVLLSGLETDNGGTIDTAHLVAPRVEAEVAFVLSHDINDADPEHVRQAVDYAVAALEIVDSRIRNWDISIVDTVADNASSAGYVLGSTRLRLDEFEPREVAMELQASGEPVSTGTGAACLDDPLNALVWVAETALRLGDPLRAGEVVLSGALGPMVPLEAGNTYEARIGPLGSVSVTAIGKE
ncbi:MULTISPECIES: 2-keto-4-pentenoate hydratase [unclassified Brevibacterium]|uniref:2-keto-4-pentenoate hydratase n=1 Tax=unclassified Brevibacterium TaxID=2614124 RepID=UPI0010918E0F|nr:fumarylacetoacetate hydrolase family protein [Brevibacterium sp. S22]TGD32564.1 2-keto-4-pentenoate hydratase [Brevibacterium sp. S22]